jgi:cyanobactin maturation PatA/PatG family protease
VLTGLGYDYITEARRDSILQHMGSGANPYDPSQVLAYLKANPWDAEAITWTLNLDATPIYAIQPGRSFASEAYQKLREFLDDQLNKGVERISVPGVITGKVRLFTGQVVPVVRPELRCMYNWTTSALVDAVAGPQPPKGAPDKEKEEYARKTQPVRNFLERIYFEFRTLGLTSEDRARNAAGTNAFTVNKIFESAVRDEMELDTIEVERSPICRPYSDCWDVKLTFFNPKKVLEQARKVYRLTFDVSDVCAVTVGPVRSWFVR